MKILIKKKTRVDAAGNYRYDTHKQYCLTMHLHGAAQEKEVFMETRVAVISIIVEDRNSVDQLNTLLHDYGQYIIGRMGLPYKERDMNIICIAIDAPLDSINTLTGAIGRLPEVSAKVTYAKQ